MQLPKANVNVPVLAPFNANLFIIDRIEHIEPKKPVGSIAKD